MKRYNIVGGPMDMEENPNGYWVTWEECNLKQLTHNKEMEKAHNRYVEELQSLKYHIGDDSNNEIDKLRTTVIIMSVVIFAGIAGFLFSWV